MDGLSVDEYDAGDGLYTLWMLMRSGGPLPTLIASEQRSADG